MRLIKVVLHGALKDHFPSFEVAGATPAEVLEGWSRQVGMDQLPINSRPLVQVLDHDTHEKLFSKLKKKVTELHIFPALFGGGGFGKIALGALMVAVSFIPGIGQAVAAALIVSGITTALMGVVELFMGSPSLSKEEDPEASKYIGNGKMTTAIGTPIGIGGGRMLIGGHLLSLQVNSTDLVHGAFPTNPT